MGKTLRERATEVGMKVVGKLFEDPRRAEAIASAIGGLQKAKATLDGAQERALRAAGLVTRQDFKSAGKLPSSTCTWAMAMWWQARQTLTARERENFTATGPPQTAQPPSTSISRLSLLLPAVSMPIR